MSRFLSEEGKAAIQGAVRELYTQSAGQVESRYIETEGFGITHALIAGPQDAPSLVLLHGSTSNSASWLGYIPEWSRLFRVIALDIPGEPGLSADAPFDFVSEAPKNWLKAVTEELRLEKFALCGQSIGAFFALSFAIANPEKVSALVLISPSGLAPVKGSFFLKALPLMFLGDFGAKRINRLIYGSVPFQKDVEDFALLVARNFRGSPESIPVYTPEELERITCPTFFTAGGRDVMLNTTQSAESVRTQISDSEVRVFDDMGHVVLGVGPVIQEFLERKIA